MLRRFLLLLCVTVACSRRPSASRAYSEALTEFRQGKLQQAQQSVDAALKNHAQEPGDALRPLRLLQTEILLARGQPRKAFELLGQLSDPQDPELHLRWTVDRADAFSKLGQSDKANALLDEADRTVGDRGTGEWLFKGLLLRGALLVNRGRFDQAEGVLTNLLVSRAPPWSVMLITRLAPSSIFSFLPAQTEPLRRIY